MKEIDTIIKGLISKNKLVLIAVIVWSMLFIYKAGYVLGEFIYYVGKS